MSLPQKFVNEGLVLAKGAKLFGQDLESLTREELLAACAQGWKAERNAREDARKEFAFMASLSLRGAMP